MTKQEFDEIVIPLSFIDNPKHRQFIKDAVNGNFNRWVKKRNEINDSECLKEQISEDLLSACIWAAEQFKILADAGRYPEHLLAQNGGNGIMPLISAINKAKERQK